MHGPAGRGRDPQQLLRFRGTRLDAHEQHVAQRRRQLVRPEIAAGRDELLGEERVAVGTGEDGLHDLGRRRFAEDAEQLRGDVVAVEAFEVDPLGAAAAFELGQERPQRVATAQLVGAERHHDRDRTRGRSWWIR